MSATPSKFSSTEAEYVRLALRTMLAAQFRTTGTQTMPAGECPLCGAPISEWASRLEDGASAITHVRCAASYTAPLQTQLTQIAVRHPLHLI